MIKKELVDNIFQTVNKIVYPADLSMKGYLIFYPTKGYYLSEKQYRAFMSAVYKLKMLNEVVNLDIEFIDSIGEISQEAVRKFSGFDYSAYKNLSLIFENCIIDEKLRWSICIYQDYWGIIYGSNELLCEMVQNYDFKGDLEQFKEEVLSGIEDATVRESYEGLINLSHIYMAR